MTDYKETINLPQTSFAMKANLPSREPQQLQFWQQIQLYSTVRTARKGCKTYILHDGPPYANGQIHLGHAVNKVLKDIVNKSHLLDGYDIPYIPGWDCHGLPIEVNVEKKHGKAGVKVDHRAFRKLCREYAREQVDIQKSDFIRLGILGDWDNPYMTMDYQIEANTIRALASITRKGYLRRGHKPVHWCFDCKSALAEAEVEYGDKTSLAIDVLFAFRNAEEIHSLFASKSNLPVAAAIWTTTPWTIPANRGLSFHPTHSYQLVQTELNAKPIAIVIAEQLGEQCRERWQAKSWQVLASGIAGSAFDKIRAQHPLYQRESVCMMADFVTLDTGTGIVHSSPAYGVDDFYVGQRYGLEIDNPVQDNGVYDEALQLFGGMHINKANEKIVDQLQNNNALIHCEQFQHSYPHCWRHKTPTIQRATPQWFIDLSNTDLTKKVLNSAAQVQWVPGWGQERMQAMMVNRPDWCISRQRSWGTPITLLLNKKTGDIHPDTDKLFERIAKKVEENGIEAWFDTTVEDLLPADECEHYRKCDDTVDVWFDSGTTHATVLQQREGLRYPANMYLEGSDQYRGWFQSSLITGVAIHDTAPYKTVLTHGFTVDEQGRKMSKSIGNTISPQKIVNKLGADVLRLWIGSTDYSAEMTLSTDILQQNADTYRRIRNTLRFLLGNTSDFEYSKDAVDSSSLVAIDAWAIENCRKVQEKIIHNYSHFQYSRVVQQIYDFCASDMGSFYLDILKDRLYTAKKDGHARRSCQSALYHILHALTRWIAPILSFTAEEVWQHMASKKNQTIFAQQWHHIPQVQNTAPSFAQWQRLQSIKTAVNKTLEEFRNTNAIGSALDLHLHIHAHGEDYNILHTIEPELRFLFISSDVTLQRADTEQEIQCQPQTSDQKKCVRCWQRRAEVGSIKGHEQICQRCTENLTHGEKRQFV